MTGPVLNRWRAVVLVAALSLSLVPAAAAAPRDPTPTVPPEDGALQQTIDPDQEVATDDVVLEAGHVDLGPRLVGGGGAPGEWTLMVHDDTRLEGSVWRPLEHAVIRVRDAAVQQVPDDPAYAFLGVDPGAGVHVVPQTQDLDVVWLGWNTQDPSVLETVDRGVTLTLRGVDGPGHLVVYLQDGGFGEPDVLWDSRDLDRRAAAQNLWVDVNTHTHANWVFSEPGAYLVSIAATATFVDGTEQTTTGTLRMAVGDGTDPEQARHAEAAPGPVTPDSGAAADPEAAEETGDGTPAWLWAVGAGAVALAGMLLAVVARGRRTRTRALADEGADG
ncbi:choice-of-anchor M domain-containing protein [Nocardioides sp. LHD-245]|uniref:choice-of-anchor M domain-containing protein n=1 Tax=Nocardioides sp. LHD-245 TaxID=3051387 RepID=UPI0027DFBB71|nr:choice-of-anchor M domain-containing protein [Nocardioides sp. LHD-245]